MCRLPESTPWILVSLDKARRIRHDHARSRRGIWCRPRPVMARVVDVAPLPGAWSHYAVGVQVRYVLDAEGNPIREDDQTTWNAFMRDADRRRVALDAAGKWTVSTVFMGMDHDVVGSGPPVLWKTMVFGPLPWGGFSCWFSNRWRALSQHDQLAERIRRSQSLPEKPFVSR